MAPPKGHARYGGRTKGVANKTTLKRAEAIEEGERRAGRPMAVPRMKELADRFFSLGNAYSPLRERKKDDKFPPDEEKSVKYHGKAADIYANVAPYETPKIQSTAIRGDTDENTEVVHRVKLEIVPTGVKLPS